MEFEGNSWSNGRKGATREFMPPTPKTGWKWRGKTTPAEANTGCMVKEESSKCVLSSAGHEGWRLHFPLQGKKQEGLEARDLLEKRLRRTLEDKSCGCLLCDGHVLCARDSQTFCSDGREKVLWKIAKRKWKSQQENSGHGSELGQRMVRRWHFI